jgi:hypothetical protein
MAFLYAFLAGTAAMLLAGVLALQPAGVAVTTIIIAGSAWGYIRVTAARVIGVRQPVGYAIAMGALLGLCIQVATLVARVAYAGLVQHHWLQGNAWNVPVLLIAAFIATVLGGVGGLIAGLQIPNAARASRLSLTIAGIAVVVLLVLAVAAVLLVLALAKAVSDGH